MTRRLIVSPHLDDAVLSCWHAIVNAPGQVTVVTLFARVPDPAARLASWDRTTGATAPARQMELRRQEDVAAITAIGADWVHCDFLDDQYRGWGRSRGALLRELRDLAGHSDEIWLPAGIGGHPDHVLAAAVALQAAAGRRCVIYADLPYAARKWHQVSGNPYPSPMWREKLRAAMLTSPYVPDRPPASYQLSALEQERKRNSIREYGSQLAALRRAHPGWWQDADGFGREWWWPLVGAEPGSLRRLYGETAHWWICRLRRRSGRWLSDRRKVPVDESLRREGPAQLPRRSVADGQDVESEMLQ